MIKVEMSRINIMDEM